MAENVSLKIDGHEVSVPVGSTIYEAGILLDTQLRQQGQPEVKIPILCHRDHLQPVAVCRACVVDIGHPMKLVPACYQQAEEGMDVKTMATSDRVRRKVEVVTELLMADHPSPCSKHQAHGDCELEVLADRMDIRGSRYAGREERPRDDSSMVIAVDHNSCILCDRCVRGCNEIKNNNVLARAGKGYTSRIAFDLEDPMGSSSCVACGECMVSCPTGALTNRLVVRPEPWEAESPKPEAVTADELSSLELFEGVSKPFLRWNEGAVVRRHFKKGEIICREGEFGSTAFLIERGSVKVFLQSPMKHVKSSRGGFRRFLTGLVSRTQDDRDDESTTKFIHIDAPVSLDYDNPMATLDAGEIFGEMTCMSHYPRSATVAAAEDVVVLEILRNVLYILQRSARSKAILEERYRKRAVESHLRGVPIFAGLMRDEAEFGRFVEYLRHRVKLIRKDPGDVIFEQGDRADSFYLVRIGFVKVSQRTGAGEHVLNYLGPGGYFGEIGLMTDIAEVGALAAAGVRTATCTALDDVDLVQITADDFKHLLKEFPAVKERLTKIAVKNLADNEENRKRIESTTLGEFLRQGLMNAQSLLVLDLEKCTRCDECTRACSDTHDGVTRLIREGLRFDKWLVASSCRSCLDPYCMVGCPVGSIRRRNSREIIIEDWCIGCGKCAENCPYGNINMHTFREKADDPITGKAVVVDQAKATMCDLCSSLDGTPSCVYACPHDAAHRMTGRDVLEQVEDGSD